MDLELQVHLCMSIYTNSQENLSSNGSGACEIQHYRPETILHHGKDPRMDLELQVHLCIFIRNQQEHLSMLYRMPPSHAACGSSNRYIRTRRLKHDAVGG
jgi:hypothetical protein